MEKGKKLWCYRRLRKKTILLVLGLCISPSFKYSSKCFAEIYRAQYENAMLVYIRGTPMVTNMPGMIISRIQYWTNKHHINAFPNAITSKKAQNHELRIYFLTKSIVACVSRNFQNALVSKRSTLIVNGYKYTASFMPDEYKNTSCENDLLT